MAAAPFKLVTSGDRKNHLKKLTLRIRKRFWSLPEAKRHTAYRFLEKQLLWQMNELRLAVFKSSPKKSRHRTSP